MPIGHNANFVWNQYEVPQNSREAIYILLKKLCVALKQLRHFSGSGHSFAKIFIRFTICQLLTYSFFINFFSTPLLAIVIRTLALALRRPERTTASTEHRCSANHASNGQAQEFFAGVLT